jgi:hypothetical protein
VWQPRFPQLVFSGESRKPRRSNKTGNRKGMWKSIFGPYHTGSKGPRFHRFALRAEAGIFRFHGRRSADFIFSAGGAPSRLDLRGLISRAGAHTHPSSFKPRTQLEGAASLCVFLFCKGCARQLSHLARRYLAHPSQKPKGAAPTNVRWGFNKLGCDAIMGPPGPPGGPTAASR